jgi:Lon protease-like protein
MPSHIPRYNKDMSPHPLPIFALSFVIFPGERIPFRIFEPHYKAMIQDCLDESGERGGREFGILFATDRDNADIGCCVRVDRILKRYPDGSIDVLVRGTRRFYVQQFVTGRSYPQAVVGYYDDEVFPDGRLANVASSLHTKLIELTTDKVEVPLFEAHDLVSFLLGHNAGLTDVERQELLEMRSERMRLEFLIAFYRRSIPRAIQNKDLKERILLNGHLRTIKPAPL